MRGPVTVGRVRARALTIAVSAVLLFQAAYILPSASAAAPSAQPTSAAQPSPGVAPSPVTGVATATPVPSALPVASSAPTASASPIASPIVDQPGSSPGLKPGATEIVAARTETSQSFDNHDGTQATQFYAEPLFYKPAGSTTYQPITLGFATGSAKDGLAGLTPALTSDQAPVTVSLFDAGAVDFLSVGNATAKVGFALPTSLARTASGVKPVVTDGHADYVGILAGGAGLRVFANSLGSKSFVVLAGVPTTPSWTFRVTAPGLTLVPQDGGSINLVDARGGVVGFIPQPYAVDSSVDAARGGGVVSDKVGLAVGKDLDGTPTVTISADPAFLAQATYPVYVDPTVTFYSTSNTYDAHTASGYSGLNFGAYQRPDSPYYYEMWLGTDPSGTSGTSYDYIHFDVTSLAGATVDSASLSMYPYHQY